MKSLLNPNPNFSPSYLSSSSLIHSNKISSLTNLPTQISLLSSKSGQRNPNLSIRSYSSSIEQLRQIQSDIQNHSTISTSFRNPKIPKPNQIVLDAQARVCTGPTQTKPLNGEQARKVLDTILKSVRGELNDEEVVSRAQLGAFFAGMTIRANSFPEATQWSEGERCAMNSLWPSLVQVLPPDVLFIADPEGSIMGEGTVRPHYIGNGTTEMRLVSGLREVLQGGHLRYEHIQSILRDMLPLEEGNPGRVSESLLSAFLIGQRMNRETDSELEAYCRAFDNELGPPPVADVRSLTHYGEPYDGNTRYFRSTLFVAAVRACYVESCLLHGVDWMPPKGGITEEQMLKVMGANTRLSTMQAKKLLEDEDVGFAYLSLREACPSLFSLLTLRDHIKKRPPIATTEKVQQFIRASGREAIVAGFYHEGYEDPLLMLMRRRGVHSGLVIKGEEGALSMTTRERSLIASKGIPVNYCSGFRASNYLSSENFHVEVNAKDYGFEPTDTPRTDRSIAKNIKLGLDALQGEKGAAYDRIVLNAGMIDHLLGCDGAEDIETALDRAREAVDSGKALNKIINYIKLSHTV